MNTPGCIELTWNYGSETADGPVYNTGNSDATGTSNGEKVKGGFGHLGITGEWGQTGNKDMHAHVHAHAKTTSQDAH